MQYFSYTSLAVILVASLLLSLIISNNAKKVLLERSEAYSILFAENLNRQVFLQFVLPTVVRYGKIALRDREQFERLDTIVRNLTRGMSIDSVTIFDSRENVVSYSTRPELVGRRNIGGIEYQRAVAGENSSHLEVSGGLLNLLPGAPPVYCKLRTFIPFRQENPLGERSGRIMGVIEVVKDLSEDLEAIIRLQAKIILFALIFTGVLFVVLAFIVARANHLMELRALERRRLEEKLHQAERLAHLGKMVATVSHEIKNPLGIVRSTAEILKKRIAKVAPGNEHLASIIVEETSRLDRIVMEFLEFARPRQIRPSRFSVCSLLSRALEFLGPELESRGIEVRRPGCEEDLTVEADEEACYQMVLNILFNAVQAMTEGGVLTVRIGLADSGESVCIEIEDSGCGIPADRLEQIFDPFFTDKHRGTGLGLPIAKSIAEQHGGRIEVVSVQGEGSTFSIHLPRTALGTGQEAAGKV